MASSIAEIVRGVPSSHHHQLLMEVARRILADQPAETPVILSDGDNPPIGYLFRVPPMPDSIGIEDEQAEDKRRLATIDNTVTLDEMLARLDFRAAAPRAGL